MLCNNSVNNIIRRDLDGIFKFAALQGDTAADLLRDMSTEEKLSGIVLWDRGKIYQGFIAVLQITGILYPWSKFLCRIANAFPFAVLSDLLYRIIAKNRYRWFGKHESCTLPAPEFRDRYILDETIVAQPVK